MGDYEDRDRYVPFRKRDVIRMLLDEGKLPTEQDNKDFEQFCVILQSIFHFEFHEKIEQLKDYYWPLNPDLKKCYRYDRQDIRHSSEELFNLLLEVLNDANFEEIPPEEIDAAYQTKGTVSVRVVVDREDFEAIRFFYRGKHIEQREKSTLFGLRKKSTEHEILERVVLLVQFKGPEYFAEKRQTDLQFEPGSTMIKLFKDVPKEDLEILFPNSQITMSLTDKLLLFVPAVVGGVPLLATKVLPAVIVISLIVSAYLGYEGAVEESKLKQAIAALSALVALGGYLLKQWMKYKNKRYEFQKELSDNLYYRNLVNNDGVFHSLVDSAEEEECKEAFLAYYFLLTSEEPLTQKQLDDRIERWFEVKHSCKLDFEVEDGVNKLERLNLLMKSENDLLQVPSLKEALARLDEIWDNYFQYNLVSADSPSS